MGKVLQVIFDGTRPISSWDRDVFLLSTIIFLRVSSIKTEVLTNYISDVSNMLNS